MAAWKRLVGSAVVVGTALVSGAEAGPMPWSRARDSFVIWLPIDPSHAAPAAPVWSPPAPAPSWTPAPVAASPWAFGPLIPYPSGVSAAPVSAPMTVQPAPLAPSSQVSTAAPWPAPPATPPAADAFVNFGAGPYPEAGSITTGNAQPWYSSAQIAGFFGGPPTPAQQAAFDATVMQRVQQTFLQSGVNVKLTDDPNVSAAHTLSLVSSTAAQALPSAIGMTDVGANGFSFIDQEAKASQTLDQLEWVVAHNLAHELMLAFGVPERFDQSGHSIESMNASWAMMTSPGATFSADAASALKAALGQSTAASAGGQEAQVVAPRAVPEPTSLALWGLGLLAAASSAFRRSRRR